METNEKIVEGLNKSLEIFVKDHIFIEKIIIPYWIDTPRSVGIGFLGLEMHIEKDRSSLRVEELAWNTEDRHIFHSIYEFSKNPFSCLKIDEEGKTERRRNYFSFRYSRGAYFTFDEPLESEEGVCFKIFKTNVTRMKQAKYYDVTPDCIYVTGSEEEIRSIYSGIVYFLDSIIFESGKYPVLNAFFN